MAVGDFRRDPSVKLQKSGPPPEGHPRRCQSFKKRERVQCGRWALTGYDYCQFHMGPTGKSSRSKVKGVYAKVLKGRLGDFLKDADNDDERKSIAGEVDVARALASEALRITSMVINAEEQGKDVEESLKLAALSVSRDSLEHVTKLVERMAKIEVLSKSTLDASQIDNVLQRIVNGIGTMLVDEVPEQAPHLTAMVANIINEAQLDEKNTDAAARVSINIT